MALNIFLNMIGVFFLFYIIQVIVLPHPFKISDHVFENKQTTVASPQPTASPTPTPTPIPLTVTIPSIHLTADIVPVGADPKTEVMDVPSDPFEVGWYQGSVTPGANGSAVLTAHYDTPTGSPAIFYNLKDIKTGDEIVIVNRNNQQLTYTVQEVINLPLQDYPKDKLFGSRGYSELNLITCAGVWNPATKLYSHRLAVTSKLTKVAQIEYLADARPQAQQYPLETLSFKTQPVAPNFSGPYIRLESRGSKLGVYLSTWNNTLSSVEIGLQYNPSEVSIDSETVLLSDIFPVLGSKNSIDGVVHLVFFANPNAVLQTSVNTGSQEVLLAEIPYQVKQSQYPPVIFLDSLSPIAPTVLLKANGEDIHSSIPLVFETKDLNR